MINYQEQKMQTMLSNETAIQQTQTDLSSFVTSCQMAGIKSDDFGMIISIIVDRVIDGANNDSPTRELKKPLLFLRMLRNSLNDPRID